MKFYISGITNHVFCKYQLSNMISRNIVTLFVFFVRHSKYDLIIGLSLHHSSDICQASLMRSTYTHFPFIFMATGNSYSSITTFVGIGRFKGRKSSELIVFLVFLTKAQPPQHVILDYYPVILLTAL